MVEAFVDSRRALMVDALDDFVAVLVLEYTEGDEGFVLCVFLLGEDCSAEKERWGMTMLAGRSFRRDRGGELVFVGDDGRRSCEGRVSHDGRVSLDGDCTSRLWTWKTLSGSAGVATAGASLSQFMIWLKKPSTPMDSRFRDLPRGREYLE